MGNTTHPEFFIFFLSFSFLWTSESSSDTNIFLTFSFFFWNLILREKISWVHVRLCYNCLICRLFGWFAVILASLASVFFVLLRGRGLGLWFCICVLLDSRFWRRWGERMKLAHFTFVLAVFCAASCLACVIQAGLRKLSVFTFIRKSAHSLP